MDDDDDDADDDDDDDDDDNNNELSFWISRPSKLGYVLFRTWVFTEGSLQTLENRRAHCSINIAH